ncbi:MAG: glycosyltransferase family 4 protein [Devosia sp.]|nr:glycosyltransferase family 4 protein [Devosia sp.]
MTPTALTIAYCGPIAASGEPARGGFEAANRRLIDDLARAGLDVVELAYAPERKPAWRKLLAYGLGFAGLAWRIATVSERWDVFHITPLRRQFMLAEFVLCHLARRRGARLVVDLRAGAIAEDVASPSRLRRAALKSILNAAELICVEGETYLELAEVRGKNALYLPNYVDAGTVGECPAAPTERINLAFLGRIVPEKGIEVAIDCVRVLHAKGRQVQLKVIGRGDEGYIARLKSESVGLPVLWLGAVPHPEVPAQLRDGHFFVFPTRHRGEGHSNALTEAMSQGLVPIVADNGFNRQVIADSGVVLDMAASGEDYATAIEMILARGDWNRLSTAARQRVLDQFTGERLLPALVERYRDLAGADARRPSGPAPARTPLQREATVAGRS